MTVTWDGAAGREKNKGKWRVRMRKRIKFFHATSDFITCTVHRKFSNFASTTQASYELNLDELIEFSSEGASFKVRKDIMMHLFLICFVSA